MARRDERRFVVEGQKLLHAALEGGVLLEAVFHAPGAMSQPGMEELLDRAQERGARVFGLREGVLERVSGTVSPQPVCAVAATCDLPLDQLLGGHPARFAPLVVCVTVRDPGNLGAILRGADAAGAAGVIVCGESADVYNPKVVRASAGALFRASVSLGGAPADVLGALAKAGIPPVATLARGGQDYATAVLDPPIAFVVGNEASGLDPLLTDQLPAAVTIPMAGEAESLNVAMAATVLCFEAARRRRLAGAGHEENLR